MSKREPSHFLEPGDRLKSKNGYSLVVIQGVTLTGYRAKAYTRTSCGEINDRNVLIGLNWGASYTKAQKNLGGKPIPIEDQIPPYPQATKHDKTQEAFEYAMSLVSEGYSITEACAKAGFSRQTFAMKRKELYAKVDSEKREKVEDEFYNGPEGVEL